MLYLVYRHWTNNATGARIATALNQGNIPVTTWTKNDQRTQAASPRLSLLQTTEAVIALLTPSAVYGWSDPFDAVRAEIRIAVQAQIPVLPIIMYGFSWEWAQEHGYLPASIASLQDQPTITVDSLATTELDKLRSHFKQYISQQSKGVETIGVDSGSVQIKDQLVSEAALEHAYLLGHASRYTKAIDAYTAGISRYPTPAHYVGRGQTHLANGDERRAEADFLHAVKEFPNDPIAYNCLGIQAEQRKDIQGALHHYDQALAGMPDNEFALLRRGINYARLNQLESALVNFDTLLEQFPTHVDGLVERGDVYALMNRDSEALEAFHTALQLSPSHIGALTSRGIAYMKLGDLAGAEEDFDVVVRLTPNSPTAHFNRGLVKQRQADYTGAIVDYTRAIQLKATYGDAYMNRAVVRRAMGLVREAIEDYTRAIELNGENPIILTNRANALCDIGQHDRGIKDYTRALSLDPDYTKALANRAFTYRDMGKYRAALKDFRAYVDTIDDISERQSIQAVIQDLEKKKWGW